MLVVSSIISIPILEPLSASRVEKVCQLALGCLDVALTIATGNFNIAGAAGKQKSTVDKLLWTKLNQSINQLYKPYKPESIAARL